jgi:hypothetical protein
MSLPRQQHEVPRFYLEHFACRHSGNVEAYDIKSQKTIEQIPEKLARVRDAYVFTREDGTKDHSVDELLWHCENEVTMPRNGVSIYDKVLAATALTSEERAIFSQFVACMHVRSPFVRRQVAELKAAAMGRVGREVAEDDAKWAEQIESLKALGTFSPKAAESVRQMFLNKSYELSISREATLISIGGLPEFAEIVHSMQWSILRAGRGDFITCDSPLVHLASRYAPHGHVDLRDQLSMLWLPLNSALCWVGHWNKTKPPMVRAGPLQLRIYNALRAGNAERQLYAMPRFHNLAGLASRRGKRQSRIQFDSVIPSDRPKVHVVRRIED